MPASTWIAFTVSGLREKYLRRSLESWWKVRGVRDCHLLLCVEPGTQLPVPEFTAWLARSFPSTQVVVNDQRLGCQANTRHALATAFAGGAAFAVLAEEDVLVAPDVLEFFGWAQRYAPDEQVAAVCAHAFRAAPGAPQRGAVRIPWFSPLVWGTWPTAWHSFVLPTWGGCTGNAEGWDQNLREQVAAAGKVCVFPTRSRAVHNGRSSTLTRWPLSDYFYQQSISGCFEQAAGPGPWHETERTPELGLVV